MLLDLVNGGSRVLIEGAEEAQYLSSGHLVYAQTGALMAVPFDVDRLALDGGPTNVTPAGMPTTPIPYQWSVSNNGTLAYATSPVVASVLSLVLATRAGEERVLGVPPVPVGQTAVFSADDRLAVSSEMVTRGGANLYTYDLEGGSGTRQITFEAGGIVPVVTPDGSEVIYTTSAGKHAMNLYRARLDGSAPEERMTESPYDHIPWSISPDGQTLLLAQRSPETGHDLMKLSLFDPGAVPEPVIAEDAEEVSGSFSPDGKWIVYLRDDGSLRQLLAVSWPNPGPPREVASGSVGSPRWSPRGDEVFFVGEEGLKVVQVDPAMAVPLSEPRTLIPGCFFNASVSVSQDAQRFLLVRCDQGEGASELRVIENWFEELKRLAPVD